MLFQIDQRARVRMRATALADATIKATRDAYAVRAEMLRQVHDAERRELDRLAKGGIR